MNIEEYDIKELEEELAIRKGEKDRKPEPLSSILNAKILEVQHFLQINIDSIEENGNPLKDFEHYCFEELLKLFYGDDIFTWINKYWIGE